VNTIASYMNQSTRLPPYLPFPKFLLKSELTLTAKIIYTLLLDRMTGSQKNGWVDEAGRCFVIYPIESIALEIGRGRSAVCDALSELSQQGLIQRKRQGLDKANRIYVLLPDERERGNMTIGNPSVQCPENRASNVRKNGCTISGKSDPNHRNKNHINNIHKKGSGIPDYSVWEGDSL